MRKYIYLLFVSIFAATNGYNQSIAPELLNGYEDSDVQECIIVMKNQLNLYGQTNGMTKDEKANFVYSQLTSHAFRSQKSLLKYLDGEVLEYKAFHIFNGVRTILSLDQARYITTHFDVERIIPNKAFKVPLNEKTAHQSFGRMDAEWGILKIKADSVWLMGIEGEGVVIGGQDTGYDFDNPLVLDKYRGYSEDEVVHDFNWHDAISEVNPLHNDTINDPSVNPCGFLSSEPCDDHGHGTHTIGTMVGRDDENLIGVAPAAQWIGCRNMDRGWGKPETYTECFEWFLAPTDLNGENADPTKAPHVINNSWGCPEIEGCNMDNWMFMETVVDNLSAAGTVVVVSAGNDGTNCGTIRNPSAIFHNSFTVGATNDDDRKAGFSSIGPVLVDSTNRIKPDVVAPGVGVRSIYLNEEFRTWNGTSMAGPHVAGAVALIINANPELAGQVDVIKEILRNTAIPLTDSISCGDLDALTVPNFYFGHGRIDVYEAVKLAQTITSTGDPIVYEQALVYPNPSLGRLTIESPNNLEIEKVNIYDVNGKRVPMNVELSGASAQLESNLSGIYIYTLHTENESYTGKFIIK